MKSRSFCNKYVPKQELGNKRNPAGAILNCPYMQIKIFVAEGLIFKQMRQRLLKEYLNIRDIIGPLILLQDVEGVTLRRTCRDKAIQRRGAARKGSGNCRPQGARSGIRGDVGSPGISK